MSKILEKHVFSLVQFIENEFSDEETVEERDLRVVTSTWVSEDRTMCWWPPANVPSDRAGRLAAMHSKPEESTWQNLPITLIQSYRTFARARKNLKAMEKGKDAEGDNTTDYEQPRKRIRRKRYVEEDEETPKRRKAASRSQQCGTESDDSSKSIPAPQLGNLEAKLNKIIAHRQVMPKPSKPKSKISNKSTEKIKKVAVSLASQTAPHKAITATEFRQDNGSQHDEAIPTASFDLGIKDLLEIKQSNKHQNMSKSLVNYDSDSLNSGSSRLSFSSPIRSLSTDTSYDKSKRGSLQDIDTNVQNEGSPVRSVSLVSGGGINDTSTVTSQRGSNRVSVGDASASCFELSPVQSVSLVSGSNRVSVGGANASCFELSPVQSVPLLSGGGKDTTLVSSQKGSNGVSVGGASTSCETSQKGCNSKTSHARSSDSSESSIRNFLDPASLRPHSNFPTTSGGSMTVQSSHLEKLYEQGETTKRMLRQILINQRRILSFVVPEDQMTANDFDSLPALPLKSEEEFDNFEEYLTIKAQKREVVKFMTSLYKENWNEAKFVNQVLREMISNSLARVISWEGTEGTKIPFKPTRLNNAIRLAVLKLFDKSDLLQAENKIQRWFCTSSQRS
ncbi:hypothetical protein KUF71_007842 [Frankliniella fusca]|uniref:DUF4806 domain-containing protein n=1 Tax=Frankliniella fusca TaxID=407009 RepID=A0AAE1HCA0_9NEOP|nr:hypothetical protein KUF71_007842 [Frankliniella fusca]